MKKITFVPIFAFCLSLFIFLPANTSADSPLCQGDLRKDKIAGDVCVALAQSQGQLLGYSVTCTNKVQECATEGGTGLTSCYDQQCYIGSTNIGAAGYLVGWEGHAASGWWQVPNMLNNSLTATNQNQTATTYQPPFSSNTTVSNPNTTKVITVATNIGASSGSYLSSMVQILKSMVETYRSVLANLNNSSINNGGNSGNNTGGGNTSGNTTTSGTANQTGYPFTEPPSVSLSLNNALGNGLSAVTINASDFSNDALVLDWSSKNIDTGNFSTDLQVTKSLTSSSGVKRECVPLHSFFGKLNQNDLFTDSRGKLPFISTLFAGKRFIVADPCNWDKTRTITYTGSQYRSGKQATATVTITTNRPVDADSPWFSYGFYGGPWYTDPSINFYGAGTWGFNNSIYYGQQTDTNGTITHSVILSGSDPFTFSNMPAGMTATSAIGADESMGGSSKIITNRFSVRLNTAGVKPDYYVIRLKPNKSNVSGYIDLPVIVPSSNPEPLDRGPAGL